MKKNIKRFLATFIVVALMLIAAPLNGFVGLKLNLDWLNFSKKASALSSSGYCGDNVYWTFDSTTGLLTISGSGAMYGYDWDESPFYDNSSIKTVVIENGVTSIGSAAFCNCTGLTSITIPDSVTSIGDVAFADCTGLTSITIPDSVTSIGSSAFSDCTGLTSVAIGNSVSSIGSSAFSRCKRLTKIVVDKNNSAYDSRENCNAIIDSSSNELVIGCKSTIIPDGVTSIGDEAFFNCIDLTSVTIPNSVTSIGDKAFYNCEGLTSVTIGNGVTSIGDYAFADCSGLTSVTIGNGVTSIGDFAFEYCTDLTCITIPDSVTCIGEAAFVFCTNLTCIAIPDSVTCIGQAAFFDTAYYNNSQNWENGVLYIGNNLITAKSNISDLYSIKENTKTIADYAFFSCFNLKSIIMPDSVTNIGKGAFYNCTGLTSVTIPDSVTSMGYSAFSGCAGLTSITIGNGVASIDSEAFYKCTGLTSVTIPDSVTSIGRYAFEGCTGLTSITIGNSVTSIGDEAFYNCTGLTDVYYYGTWDQWYDIDIDISNDCLIYCNIHVIDSEFVKAKDGATTQIVELGGIKCIFGLNAGITQDELLNDFIECNNVDVKIDGSTSKQYIGTGSVINIYSKDGTLLDEYIITIFGDVNGDSWYDGTDAVVVSLIANGMLTKEQVGEAVYMAADCNHDGTIDEFDVEILQQAGLLLANVDQSKSADELKTDSAYIEYLNLIDQNPTEDEPTTEISFFQWFINFIVKIFSFIKNIVLR